MGKRKGNNIPVFTFKNISFCFFVLCLWKTFVIFYLFIFVFYFNNNALMVVFKDVDLPQLLTKCNQCHHGIRGMWLSNAGNRQYYLLKAKILSKILICTKAPYLKV